jgi:putative ABC transport system ATP-binding protein
MIYTNRSVPTVALRDISLSIEEGDFVAIQGPSGSGKSTLLHLMGLLARPTRGEVKFAHQQVSRMSDEELAQIRNRKIGFVFQAFYFLPRLTVWENVALPLCYARMARREREERARMALAEVNMLSRLRHTPSQISGGESQRAAIARAIVTNPAIILADEPTGNLDTASGTQVMHILQKLHQKGKTVVLVTHNNTLAQKAKRRISLRDGRIVADTATFGE